MVSKLQWISQPLIPAEVTVDLPELEGSLYIKTRRLRIEIALLSTAIACVLALLMAMLGAAAGALESNLYALQNSSAQTEQTYEGMITCSRCGAKHSADLARTADVCVRVCVHGGANFALVNAEATYLLEGDMASLKKLAGQRARVVGSLSGNTLKVSSASAQI